MSAVSNTVPAALCIRPSTDDDIAAMAAIYAHAVQHGTGTFETTPPDAAELASRRSGVLAQGWPWLVAAQGPAVLGYAYASQFRPRPAYRFTLEDSVYLAPASRGLGIGRLLLAELVARCQALGARQMLAVIGDSANHGSVRLHQALGFAPVGTFKHVGHKFGSWLDVVLMQRSLGAGASTHPADRSA